MGAGERRRLIILGSVLGLVVVVFLAKMVLFSGGGGSKSAVTTATPTTLAAGQTTTTTTPSSRSTRTPATFDVFATKNPFEPVIIVTPTTSGTGVTTPTTGTTGTTGTPGTPGTNPSGPGVVTTTTVPSNEPAQGTSVALLDVFQQADGTPMAKVQVGSTVYTVGAGDVFAVSYRVVSLNAPCGQFLFGDAPFKLCVGEEVIK
jgi:hypothetical protein